jgi:starch synthase (maltosyl-transferring)
VISEVRPHVDGGLHPIKRVLGERVEVEATLFAEGHDRLQGVLLFRHTRGPGAAEAEWTEAPLEPREPAGTDRWGAAFEVDALGRWEYAVEVWVDAFATWRAGLRKKVDAGLGLASELREGAQWVADAAERAEGAERRWLAERAQRLDAAGSPEDERVALALDDALAERMARHPDRRRAVRSGPLGVVVERERGRSGAWYEFFPRSCAPEPGRHGTLADCEARLAHAAAMGFDVVYLPPIHPIGSSHRKGPNNTTNAAPGDPGSPWAIGGPEGGHTAVHPELGSLDDFDRMVATAGRLGLEVALDVAFQCSPDHPWVKDHPDWFRRRPDGSIQYAENPPKKYQDIYPLDFECDDWRGLWQALLDVALFWAEHGVTIFRVDNPHTKPFAFWEWWIARVRERHPEAVFLSEAFTRPAVLKHLAKIGFSQSYTYFTWRNTKWEIESFVRELWSEPVRQYLRPNFFANTPDILHAFLQTGGRPAFQIRLLLAATLADSYGIYGPPFELCVGESLGGSEEYLDSEKYQVRHWDVRRPGNVVDTVTRVNRIRREHRALTAGTPPRFCPVDNPEIVAYLREPREGEGDDLLLVAVNLDPHHVQRGWIELPLDAAGLDPSVPYQVDDLLGGGRFLWHGARNFLEIDPRAMPGHVFRLRRRVRTERDFDYYL